MAGGGAFLWARILGILHESGASMLDKNDSRDRRSLIAPVLLAQLRASMAIEPQERGSLLQRFGGSGDWLEDLLAQPDVVALHLPDGLLLGLLEAHPLGRVSVFDVSAGSSSAGAPRLMAEILGLKRDFHYVRMRGACPPLMRDLPPEVHYAAAGYSGFMGAGLPCAGVLLSGLLARSHDAQGGLVFGAPEAARVGEGASVGVPRAGRAKWYATAARGLQDSVWSPELQKEVLRHPVGGAHPKFCCRLRSIGLVVVKFARAGTFSAEALVANAIALKVLGEAGFDVAKTGIATEDGWVFHESLRLDRSPQGGRRVLTSASHVDEVVLNAGEGWLNFAATAQVEGLLSEADAARVAILALFSSMIRGDDDWRLAGSLDDLLLVPRVPLSPQGGYVLAATHCLGFGRSAKSPLRANDIEGLRVAPADCPARLVSFWEEAFALACRYFEAVSTDTQIPPLDA